MRQSQERSWGWRPLRHHHVTWEGPLTPRGTGSLSAGCWGCLRCLLYSRRGWAGGGLAPGPCAWETAHTAAAISAHFNPEFSRPASVRVRTTMQDQMATSRRRGRRVWRAAVEAEEGEVKTPTKIKELKVREAGFLVSSDPGGQEARSWV